MQDLLATDELCPVEHEIRRCETELRLREARAKLDPKPDKSKVDDRPTASEDITSLIDAFHRKHQTIDQLKSDSRFTALYSDERDELLRMLEARLDPAEWSARKSV